MQWPKEILDLFSRALQIVPARGHNRREVIRELLDETARRAVTRARRNPALAGPALRSTYTPMGSVINEGVNGLAARIGLGGPNWSAAVEAFNAYVEGNAKVVFDAFHGRESPYDSLYD
jgi:hypothetical protein